MTVGILTPGGVVSEAIPPMVSTDNGLAGAGASPRSRGTSDPLRSDSPLRVAFLTYRGKEHVGGQGVYTRHLTKALADLGHHVEVLSGQPYPVVADTVPLIKLPSLDIYNDHYPMRMPGVWELKDSADWVETLAFTAGMFPEPLAFSVRAAQYLQGRRDEFDLVQDNQCLGYGLLAMERFGLPVLGTIHHPISVDRRLEIEHSDNFRQRFSKARWYGFVKMQTRVAKRLRRIITVSESSYADICRDHLVSPERLHIVPVGVDPDLFKPLPEVTRRTDQIISTASADVTMKGQRYLLEALAKIRTTRDVKLVIIGKLKEGSKTQEALERYGLFDAVTFVSGVPDEEIVRLYSESAAAVVPSLYEGFSLPAIEAMATGCPLVATTGGAIPEFTGKDGETCFAVPPGDSDALAAGILRALEDPEAAQRIGMAGRERVVQRWTWRNTALRTVEHYRALLAERERETHQ